VRDGRQRGRFFASMPTGVRPSVSIRSSDRMAHRGGLLHGGERNLIIATQQAPGGLINSLMSLDDEDAAVCRCLVRAFARRYVPKMAYPPICHLHVGI